MPTQYADVHPFTSGVATVAFVDLAGFSAITDVYGDASAIAVLERFEALVGEALGPLGAPIKWIGDEAMFGFPDPATALQVLGRLLPACRAEPRIPLTRTALNHGPVLRRSNDLFGSTVNIAARIAALAEPGQLLATDPVADVAIASGIVTPRHRKRRASIDRSPGTAPCRRARAGVRSGVDRPGLQDARALRGVSQDFADATLVLLRTLRRGLSTLAARLFARIERVGRCIVAGERAGQRRGELAAVGRVVAGA